MCTLVKEAAHFIHAENAILLNAIVCDGGLQYCRFQTKSYYGGHPVLAQVIANAYSTSTHNMQKVQPILMQVGTQSLTQ